MIVSTPNPTWYMAPNNSTTEKNCIAIDLLPLPAQYPITDKIIITPPVINKLIDNSFNPKPIASFVEISMNAPNPR